MHAKTNVTNLLRGTCAYTCGHMEFADGRAWREKVTKELGELGIRVYDPYHKPFLNAKSENEEFRQELKKWMEEGRYDEVAEHFWDVRAFDLNLVDRADFIVAHLIPQIASWGSAEEFYWANRLKKPIFLSIEGGKKKTPVWIMGTLNHKYIYESLEDSLEMIKAIDSGTKEIDSKRWRLLLPEFRF